MLHDAHTTHITLALRPVSAATSELLCTTSALKRPRESTACWASCCTLALNERLGMTFCARVWYALCACGGEVIETRVCGKDDAVQGAPVFNV